MNTVSTPASITAQSGTFYTGTVDANGNPLVDQRSTFLNRGNLVITVSGPVNSVGAALWAITLTGVSPQMVAVLDSGNQSTPYATRVPLGLLLQILGVFGVPSTLGVTFTDPQTGNVMGTASMPYGK